MMFGQLMATNIPADIGLARNPHPYGLPAPAGSGWRLVGGLQEFAVDPALAAIIAYRIWDVWVNPATGEFRKVLFHTWTGENPPDTAALPGNWRDFHQYTDVSGLDPYDQAAADRAPAEASGGWLKESVFWNGDQLMNTAARRLGQPAIVYVAGAAALRTDTLALVQSVDAGGPPVVQPVPVLEAPLSPAHEAWELARIGKSQEEQLAAGLVTMGAPAVPLAPVYFVGGQYWADPEATIPLTSAEVAEVFAAPAVSPVVVAAAAGTPAAIVTAYGGGPGTSYVPPTIGLEPVEVPLTPEETEELVAAEWEAYQASIAPAYTPPPAFSSIGVPMAAPVVIDGQPLAVETPPARAPWLWLALAAIGGAVLLTRKRKRAG